MVEKLIVGNFKKKRFLSKIVSINRKETDGLKIYPNPVSHTLTVQTDGAGDFRIFNLLGQTVLTGRSKSNIDVSTLPQGAYFLKMGQSKRSL